MFVFRTSAIGSAALAGAVATAMLALAGCGPSSSTAGSSTSPSGGSTSKPASSSGSGSQNSGSATTTAAYFPVGVGYTWKYNQQGYGSAGTVTNRVTAVTSVASGEQVMMTSDVTDPKATVTHETLIIHPDGSVEVPMNQFGSEVTLKSGAIVWPSAAQLASGQPYHNTLVLVMHIGGKSQTLRMPLTVRGEGTSPVTVPAGTFQATKIVETMATSMDGYKVTMAVDTWVANGVGPVKSAVYGGLLGGSGNKPATQEELASFTK